MRKDEIEGWIADCKSKSYMCRQLQCKQETLNSYLKKFGLEYSGNQSGKGMKKNQYKPALIYIENKLPISSYKLKNKLIRDGIKKDCCELCGNSIWMGHKIPLELHHIDGNHFNNSIDNLQILCPNCHAIQPGNSGANMKKRASDGIGRQL